jgi:hypothetical protein
VTAIRADYEFAKAFYTPTAPRPRLGILRRLERRCSGRHFFHSRCADRNGTRTQIASPAARLRKKSVLRMDTSSGESRRRRRRFPSLADVAVTRASMLNALQTEKIDVYLFQPKLEPYTTTLNPAGVARRTHLTALKSGGPAGWPPRMAWCAMWL